MELKGRAENGDSIRLAGQTVALTRRGACGASVVRPGCDEVHALVISSLHELRHRPIGLCSGRVSELGDRAPDESRSKSRGERASDCLAAQRKRQPFRPAATATTHRQRQRNTRHQPRLQQEKRGIARTQICPPIRPHRYLALRSDGRRSAPLRRLDVVLSARPTGADAHAQHNHRTAR